MADDSSRLSFVIAISGVPGSGKSTLIQKVNETLGGVVTLHFDDYGGTSIFPEDFKAWLASGGDPNDWKTPLMTQVLLDLRSGHVNTHPRSGVAIEPQPIIMVEEPFGRSRQEISAYVDFAAHIHVPLDIALIRLVRRMLADNESCADAERQECSQIVDNLFRLYLNDGMRELMHYTDTLAANSADIILDGIQTSDDLAVQFIEAVQPRLAIFSPA